MTNLSKELCKICGIEPKISCANCSHPCEAACNNCSYGELTYPDFENNNNNFVKLFKLITTLEDFYFGTGNFYIPSIPSYRQDATLKTDDEEYYSSNPDPIQAFITCVIKHCKRNKDTADYIRAEEWVYD